MNRIDFLDRATDYLHDALTPDERAAFETYLQQYPQARQDLILLEAMGEAFAQRAESETEAAWAVMKQRLDAEAKPNPALVFWRRWRLRLGLLIAVAVASIEAFMLINAPVYRAVAVAEDVREVRVLFAPDARQGQVRELLDQVRGQIKSGPGASGEYVLVLPGEQSEAALAILRSAPIVEDAYLGKGGRP